jgi:hypothetical protein
MGQERNNLRGLAASAKPLKFKHRSRVASFLTKRFPPGRPIRFPRQASLVSNFAQWRFESTQVSRNGFPRIADKIENRSNGIHILRLPELLAQEHLLVEVR